MMNVQTTVWSLFLVVLCSRLDAQGCGILTHTEIGHRALSYFTDNPSGKETMYKKLMQEHQDAFQAGNPYPDTFYNKLCHHGDYHQVSEDTHWTPFMVTTIDYIRDKYPPPWNVATQKLVAFLFGFVSHQIADVLWHNLGVTNGFLQAMADANYHGVFGKAHDAGDLGGDVVGAFEWNKTFVEDTTWYVPSEDLQEIYKRYYQEHGGSYNMSASLIEECFAWIFLGRFGEKLALKEAYSSYAKGSPFLVEELHEYFIGGVDDNAAWSALLWYDTITMLENGTDACVHGERPISVKCPQSPQRKRNAELFKKNSTPLFAKLVLNGLDFNYIDVQRALRGVHIRPSAQLLQMVAEKERQEKKEQENSVQFDVKAHAQSNGDISTQVTYVSKLPYARFGWSLAVGDVNGDKFADLVLSAPGYTQPSQPLVGCVYAVVSHEGRLPGSGTVDVESIAFAKIVGVDAYGRFGTGLALVDLNKDGQVDIAGGAPSKETATLGYSGAVHVFFGHLGQFPAEPNASTVSNHWHENRGWSLAGGDLDGDGFADLVVGSPFLSSEFDQVGGIMIFTSSSFKPGHALTPTLTLFGSVHSAWFGHSLRVSPENHLLLVGSPDYHLCKLSPSCASFSPNDTQSVGNLTIYQAQPSSADLQTKLSMHGVKNFEKFGTASDIGLLLPNTLVLAVSSATADVQGHIAGVSTTFHQGGRVSLYNLSSTSSQHEPFAILEGDRSFAHFGWAVELNDINSDGFDDLLISAPFRDGDLTDLVGGENGQAYIFLGGKHFPSRTDITNTCNWSVVHPCPADVAAYTLNIQEGKSRFGSAIAVVRMKQSLSTFPVAVSAVRSDAASRLAGAVHIFDLNH